MDDWATSNPGDPSLVGSGYEFVLADLDNPVSRAEINRVRPFVRKLFRFHIATNGIAFQLDDDALELV